MSRKYGVVMVTLCRFVNDELAWTSAAGSFGAWAIRILGMLLRMSICCCCCGPDPEDANIMEAPRHEARTSTMKSADMKAWAGILHVLRSQNAVHEISPAPAGLSSSPRTVADMAFPDQSPDLSLFVVGYTIRMLLHLQQQENSGRPRSANSSRCWSSDLV